MFWHNLPATSFARTLLTRASAALMRTDLETPALVSPSVADNFTAFSNTAGAQKDSGKGLSHLVYTLQYGSTGLTVADSTTYYVGGSVVIAQTVAALIPIVFPKGGTVVYADIRLTAVTAGTNETFSAYLRINNTTDVLISSSLAITGSTQFFQNNALSTAVNAGDFFEVKVVTPTWVTNPSNVRIFGTVMVQV